VLKALEAEPVTAKALADAAVKSQKEIEDRWIISRLNRLVREVDTLMKGFQFGEAEKEIHDFLWGEFCDWYIEISKQRLGKANSPMAVLAFVLETSLRLLHPFMPFITEELWQNLRERLPEGTLKSPALIIAPYPQANAKLLDAESEQVMQTVMEVVRTIRNARAEYKVEMGKWVESSVYAGGHLADLKAKSAVIETLAKTRPLSILPRKQRPANAEKAMVYVLKDADVVIPLAGMVDVEAEKARLTKEMEILDREINRLSGRLADSQFTTKAPPAVIDKERSRLQEYQDKFARMQAELQQLG
jgi:valyl-tRNA synthetase